MAGRMNIEASFRSIDKNPYLEALASHLGEKCFQFYEDPENEEAFQNWMKERKEREGEIKEKMSRYKPGSRMWKRLRRSKDRLPMPKEQSANGLVYAYSLVNAWGGKLNTLTVIDDEDSYVVYCFAENDTGSAYCAPAKSGEIVIDKEKVEKIRNLLNDERLFETEWLEDPYDKVFLDGFMQVFEIMNQDKYIRAEGDNIDCCRGDPEHCLHSFLFIRVLEEVKNILVPCGVPEECFRLLV